MDIIKSKFLVVIDGSQFINDDNIKLMEVGISGKSPDCDKYQSVTVGIEPDTQEDSGPADSGPFKGVYTHSSQISIWLKHQSFLTHYLTDVGKTMSGFVSLHEWYRIINGKKQREFDKVINCRFNDSHIRQIMLVYDYYDEIYDLLTRWDEIKINKG